MKALILVDLQNDFMPGGALAVTEGDKVVPLANRLAAKFSITVATQDWHPQNHTSFASNNPGHAIGSVIELNGIPQVLWPDHCIQGSHGAGFHADLNTALIGKVFKKGTYPQVDSYSGFFDNNRAHATGLAEWLREQGVKTLYIMGLATDYCVKYTALDAAQLGFETFLIEDGCRGVELQPGDVKRAIDEMRKAGIKCVSGNEI